MFNTRLIKSFFANISLLVLLNMLIKPAWLLLENIVQNKIGHLQYGTFAALYSLGFLFITVTDLGINMYTTKKVAGDPENLRDIFANAISLKMALTLMYPIFMAGLGYILGYSSKEIYFLAVLCLTQALLQILLFFRSGFQARQFFKIDSIVSVSDKIILMIILLFLLEFQLTLDSYIYARLGSAVISVVIFYLVMLKVYGWIKPSLNLSKIRKILQLSFPFALMTILYAVNEKIDQVMLERLGDPVAGKIQAGLYAGAYRWLEAFQMYLWTIQPFFFAKFAFHHKEKNKLQEIFTLAQVVSAVPMIFISMFVFFYAEKLFWLFDNSSSEQISVMVITCQILFVSAFINGFFAQYSTALSCLGYEKKLSWVIVISTIINVLINFLFIPTYGPFAAAWSTLASVLFLTVFYVLMVRNYLDVSIPWTVIVKLLLLSAVLFFVFFFLKRWNIDWYLTSLIAALVTLILCFVFRFHHYIKQTE